MQVPFYEVYTSSGSCRFIFTSQRKPKKERLTNRGIDAALRTKYPSLCPKIGFWLRTAIRDRNGSIASSVLLTCLNMCHIPEHPSDQSWAWMDYTHHPT